MTNHQIGVALQKIARLLGSFATQLMNQKSPTVDNKVVHLKPKSPPKAAPAKLSKRHATIVAKFKKAGIKDPKLFTDIKTFDLWSKDGFVVRKGQQGIHGLFHRSQVQPAG